MWSFHGLSVARDDIIRQRQEGIALGARWEGAQRLAGALGELLGAAEGVVDRPMLVEHLQELVPLLLGHGPRRNDVPDNALAGRLALPEQVDERQRHLAFAQICADR